MLQYQHMKLLVEMQNIIKETLAGFGIADASAQFERPADMVHGDYATNVAMMYAKQIGTNPRELAEKIVATLQGKNISEIAQINIAGPGFINITLSAEYFYQSIQEIFDKKDWYGKNELLLGQKILIEHSSPNLFKPFHIGHLMNNAIGESLVRIMKSSGAQVTTLSFPSDISLGIAKALFVLLEEYGNNYEPNDVSILGDAYVTGTRLYDENESIHVRVKEIADNLYAEKDSPEWELYQKCKKINLAYFEQVIQNLDSHIDAYMYESQAGIIGKQLVEKNTPQVFIPSEGAIIYVPEQGKKGLHTAVFINSQGNPTYEAKDLGLIQMKFEKYQPDQSLFITDIQQVSHFAVVLDAMQKINSNWSNKSQHITHGRMTLRGQKMSSRMGGVPLAEEIIDMVMNDVRSRSNERGIDQETQQSIALAAIKFSILKARPGQNIDFNPETSVSFEGDSGPYLQYTHARIQTLLEKAKDQELFPVLRSLSSDELLVKLLDRFPEVVLQATTDYAPSHIVTYTLELARAFNSFYGNNTFIDGENREQSENYLALAQATRQVISNALDMLGIHAPNKM
jgi:arginyl-tRNA synthetase